MVKEYPCCDDGDYVSKGQDLFALLKSQSISDAPRLLYSNRLWKPTIHPLFLIPGLFLTGGKVLSAVFFVNLFFFFAFLAGIYKLARIFLKETEASAVTLFVGTVPFILSKFYSYNGELSAIVFLTWALYFLLTSDFFSKLLPSLCFALVGSLAVASRPLESLLLLFFPLVTTLYFSLKTKKTSLLDLILNIPPYLSAVLLVALKQPSDQALAFVFWGQLAYFPLIFAVRWILRTTKINPALLAGNALFTTSVIFWYLDFIPNLINWCWGCSFGLFARDTSSKIGQTRAFFAKWIYESYVSNELWILALAGGLLFFVALYEKKTKKIERNPLWIVLIVSALLGPLAHAIGGILSYNADTRYYSITLFAIYATAAIAALYPKPSLRWVGRWTGPAVIALCIACNVFVVFENFAEKSLDSTGFIRFIAANARSFAPLNKESAASAIVDALQSKIPHSKLAVSKPPVSILLYNEFKDEPARWLADQFLLQVIVKERNLPYKVQTPFFSSDAKTDERSLLRDYDYLLIGPLEGQATKPDSAPMGHKLFANLLENQNKFGLNRVVEIPVESSSGKNKFLLMRIEKQ